MVEKYYIEMSVQDVVSGILDCNAPAFKDNNVPVSFQLPENHGSQDVPIPVKIIRGKDGLNINLLVNWDTNSTYGVDFGYRDIDQEDIPIQVEENSAWIRSALVEIVYLDDVEIHVVWISEPPIRLHSFTIRGTEAREFIVRSGSNSSARINVPADWQGKRVMIVRLE